MPWTIGMADSEPAGSASAWAMDLAMGCCCHMSAMAEWHAVQAAVPTKLAESSGGCVAVAAFAVVSRAWFAETERG